MKVWFNDKGNGKFDVFVAFNGIVVGKAKNVNSPADGIAKLADVIFKYGN